MPLERDRGEAADVHEQASVAFDEHDRPVRGDCGADRGRKAMADGAEAIGVQVVGRGGAVQAHHGERPEVSDAVDEQRLGRQRRVERGDHGGGVDGTGARA